MSSLDSQSLSLGTMFTQDIVRHYGFQNKMNEKKQILYGRLFVLSILAISYILSLITERSIFRMAVWSFTGFAALFPVVFAALFWKRSTKYGAMASIASVCVLWTYYFFQGGQDRTYTVGGTGIMPVASILLVSAIAMIVVSLLTKPPEKRILDKFFPSATS